MGMNALFIYLFFEIVGSRWFNGYIRAITDGLSAPLGLTTVIQGVLGSAVIFALEWGICRFLFNKRIFFRV
jgi:hypothetical protein